MRNAEKRKPRSQETTEGTKSNYELPMTNYRNGCDDSAWAVAGLGVGGWSWCVSTLYNFKGARRILFLGERPCAAISRLSFSPGGRTIGCQGLPAPGERTISHSFFINLALLGAEQCMIEVLRPGTGHLNWFALPGEKKKKWKEISHLPGTESPWQPSARPPAERQHPAETIRGVIHRVFAARLTGARA